MSAELSIPEAPEQPDDSIPLRSVPAGDISRKRPYLRRLICKDCGLVLGDLFVKVELKGQVAYYLCLDHGLPVIEQALQR